MLFFNINEMSTNNLKVLKNCEKRILIVECLTDKLYTFSGNKLLYSQIFLQLVVK